MSTVIRPELSKRNDYYISKHRYYELRHFCLQYGDFKKKYLDGPVNHSVYKIVGKRQSSKQDPVASEVEYQEHYRSLMSQIETASEKTDKYLGNYIFTAVTEGFTYDQLNARVDIPCSRTEYYKLYRKFFWLLDKEHG